jgi:hypothetical protein
MEPLQKLLDTLNVIGDRLSNLEQSVANAKAATAEPAAEANPEDDASLKSRLAKLEAKLEAEKVDQLLKSSAVPAGVAALLKGKSAKQVAEYLESDDYKSLSAATPTATPETTAAPDPTTKDSPAIASNVPGDQERLAKGQYTTDELQQLASIFNL